MVKRVLVLEGASLQHLQKRVDIVDEQIGRALQLHVEAGVEHIGRGHALMHEARFRADDLGQMRQEGDDVVPGLALDLVDARHVEDGVAALLPDLGGGLLRHEADLRHGIERVRLDLEPDAQARLRRPDGGHRRPAVTGDHAAPLTRISAAARIAAIFSA